MIIKFHFLKDVADHLQTFWKGFKNENVFEIVYPKYNASWWHKPPILINLNTNDKDSQLPSEKVSKLCFKWLERDSNFQPLSS